MDQVALVSRFPGEDDEVFVPCLELRPGGSAANFAVFCSRLGGKAGFVGKVGRDNFGDVLISDLVSEGVDTNGVVRSDLPTGTVFIAVRSDGQRMMFACSGAANDLHESDISPHYLNRFDHLHLADLNNIAVLKHAASLFEGSVSLNPGALIADKGKEALDLIKEVDILICSKNEARKLTGEKSIENCLQTLTDMGPETAVVTCGPEPPLAMSREGATVTAQTHDIKIVDTTGAGDSFSAGFVSEFLRSRDMGQALRFGVATAEIVIQHRGARAGLKNRKQVERVLPA